MNCCCCFFGKQRLLILVSLSRFSRSPSHFTEEWFSKLKQNPENWRLKISNLKKILDRLSDYYENLMPAYANIELPDLNKICKDEDHVELARLVQLVLGIAVNCDDKQQYIQEITKLDLNVQQNLMEAIQQLMSSSNANLSPSTADYLHTNGQLSQSNQNLNHHAANFLDSLNENSSYHLQEQFLRTMENLRLTNEKKETILQQNYELNKRLIAEQNEKLSLQNEYERLMDRYNSLNAKRDDLDLEGSDIFKNKHVIKLQKRIEQLEKDMIILENQKEENLIKLELVEKEVLQLRLLNENLQRKAKENQHLQDELDVHKHSSDKIQKYEQKLDIYQKKIEEFANLKREYNLIEKKNVELVAKNLELEEELKKPSIFKQQIQDYKKKIQELQQQIVEKTRDCDKLEFDLERHVEKFNYLNQEKLMADKENAELKSRMKQLGKSSLSKLNIKDEVDSLQMNGQLSNLENNRLNSKLMNNCLNYEINDFSNDLKEKLTRIELENKLLKQRLNETNQEAVLLLRTSYEDAKTRVNELEKDNRKLNRTIVEMESKLNDSTAAAAAAAAVDQSSSDQSAHPANNPNQFAKLKELEEQLRTKMKTIALFNDQIYDLEQKITKLEGSLRKKDDEFNEMDAKYKKYLLKAKQAVSFLEPISLHLNSLSSLSPSNSSVNSICNNHLNQLGQLSNGQQLTNSQAISNGAPYTNEEIYATNNVELLKKALAERDKKINEMTISHERERNLKEMEQRLITVAFHNLSYNYHRKAATERILNSTTQSQADTSTLTPNSSSSNLMTGSMLLTKQRQPTTRKRLTNLNNNINY